MSEPMDPNMRVWGYTASELRRAINIAANYEPGWYAGVRFILPDIDPEDAALIVAAVNALPSLLDERERLRAALDEYGDHNNWCTSRDYDGPVQGQPKCSCGWREAALATEDKP